MESTALWGNELLITEYVKAEPRMREAGLSN